MTNDTADTVASWFEDGELSECPRCGQQTFTQARQPGSVRICVSCAFLDVGEPDLKPSRPST